MTRHAATSRERRATAKASRAQIAAHARVESAFLPTCRVRREARWRRQRRAAPCPGTPPARPPREPLAWARTRRRPVAHHTCPLEGAAPSGTSRDALRRAVPAGRPGHAPRFPTREGVLPCRAHAPTRNPPFATLALGRAPRTRLPFVPRLLRLTPLPTRYPSHRPGRSAVRCRAVRSSSPSKRGEKAQLSTGKDGRGKTLSTSAVSPPDAEIGACPPSRSAWAFSGCRRRAHLSSLGNRGGARVPPPNGRAPRRSSDATARVSPATHRRARFASDPRLPAPPPTRRADRPPPRPHDSPEPTARPRFARRRRPPASIRQKKKIHQKKQPTLISARSTSP